MTTPDPGQELPRRFRLAFRRFPATVTVISDAAGRPAGMTAHGRDLLVGGPPAVLVSLYYASSGLTDGGECCVRQLVRFIAAIRVAWPDRSTGSCLYCDQQICGCNAVVIAIAEGYAGVCLVCFKEQIFEQLKDLPAHLVGTPICEHGWTARLQRLRRVAVPAARR